MSYGKERRYHWISGNTGSSAAPHFHFEIRDSQNQYPQNGLQFGFDITDNIPPVIKELKVYSTGKKHSY